MMKKTARKTTKKATTKKAAAKKTSVKKAASKKTTATRKKKLSQEKLSAMIAAKAYELYESRGYAHGDDQYDWYVAEQMVLGKK